MSWSQPRTRVPARPPKSPPMQLDYFQLIDRVVDLNLENKTITVEAQVPEKHTIFEGHFPGFPIMPGVLLTEAMAQSCGWLILGALKFERMPFQIGRASCRER